MIRLEVSDRVLIGGTLRNQTNILNYFTVQIIDTNVISNDMLPNLNEMFKMCSKFDFLLVSIFELQ